MDYKLDLKVANEIPYHSLMSSVMNEDPNVYYHYKKLHNFLDFETKEQGKEANEEENPAALLTGKKGFRRQNHIKPVRRLNSTEKLHEKLKTYSIFNELLYEDE